MPGRIEHYDYQFVIVAKRQLDSMNWLELPELRPRDRLWDPLSLGTTILRRGGLQHGDDRKRARCRSVSYATKADES